jgi:predicted amino acid-binding ACT domain protein
MALEAQKIASAERMKAAELQFQREKLSVDVQMQRESMMQAAQIAASKPEPTDTRPSA